MNNFHSRKKTVQEPVFSENKEIPPERLLQEYLAGLTEEMNYRLLCENMDTVPEVIRIQCLREKYHTEVFLPPGQVLWVEKITVTGCDHGACSRQEKQEKRVSLWERIKKRLWGRERKQKQSFHLP